MIKLLNHFITIGLALVLVRCNATRITPKRNYCCCYSLFKLLFPGDKEKPLDSINPNYQSREKSDKLDHSENTFDTKEYFNKRVECILEHENVANRMLFEQIKESESWLNCILHTEENTISPRIIVPTDIPTIDKDKEVDKNKQIVKLDKIVVSNDTNEHFSKQISEYASKGLEGITNNMQVINDLVEELGGLTKGEPNMEDKRDLFDEIKDEYLRKNGILYEENRNES